MGYVIAADSVGKDYRASEDPATLVWVCLHSNFRGRLRKLPWPKVQDRHQVHNFRFRDRSRDHMLAGLSVFSVKISGGMHMEFCRYISHSAASKRCCHRTNQFSKPLCLALVLCQHKRSYRASYKLHQELTYNKPVGELVCALRWFLSLNSHHLRQVTSSVTWL